MSSDSERGVDAPPSIELSAAEMEKWVTRALCDTGFVCRELLGFNYDIDHKTNRKINIGSGGVRDCAPFTDIARFMDDPAIMLAMVLAPRGGLKSSVVRGDCTRNILCNPDSATLFMSGTTPQVDKWSRSIRKVFEESTLLEAMFGMPLPGDPWTVSEWTISARRDKTIADPTFRTGSLMRLPTGGHYNRIYLDDLIDWRNCRTQLQLDTARAVLHLIQPLRLPGGKIIVTGTRYNPGDLYSYIETLPGWSKLVLGTGFEIQETASGLYSLTGEKPLFPHLTKDYLEEQLRSMAFEDFCAQYMNRHVAGLSAVFRREHFQSVQWEEPMSGLTTWILTDSATSTKKGACASVALVVGLDAARRIYLLDGFVGRVEPAEFVEELFSLHVRWQQRTNLAGWTIEKVTMAQMLQGWITSESRRRQIRLNIREIPRSGGERSKDDRIRRLQPKFRAGDIYVVDTFPRTYRDSMKVKTLWDPEGYTDTNSQKKLPGGELVEQFAQFPYYPWKDIADALADAEYYYRDNEPACYVRRAPPAVPQQAYGAAQRAREPWIDGRQSAGNDWLRGLGRAPR